MAAPANGDGCPSTQPERLSFLIHNLKIPFNAQRPIIEYGDFRTCQGVLRSATSIQRRNRALKISICLENYKQSQERASSGWVQGKCNPQ